MSEFFDFILNIDAELKQAVETYGGLIYFLIFLIVFSETGLIILAILPGDSLLFAAGSLAAIDVLSPVLIFSLMPLAAFAGDQANYGLGKLFGKKLFNLNIPLLFNKKSLDKADTFYDDHGKSTVILGRFIPLIRSFIPFIAATGKMDYLNFTAISAVGATIWSLLFVSLGFFLGKIPFVKDHLYLVIIAIVVITIIPGLISYFNDKKK